MALVEGEHLAENQELQLKKMLETQCDREQVITYVLEHPEVVECLTELLASVRENRAVNAISFVEGRIKYVISNCMARNQKLKDLLIASLVRKIAEDTARTFFPRRYYCISVLGDAAFLGADISLAVPVLEKSLNGKDRDVQFKASRALLAFPPTRKKGIACILKFMPDTGTSQYKQLTMFVVSEAARKGISLPEIMPKLAVAASHKDKCVRLEALRTIGTAAENGMNVKLDLLPVEKALTHKDKDTRSEAAETIRKIAEANADISSSIPVLKEIIAKKEGNPYFLGIKRDAAEALGASIKNPKSGERALSALIDLLSSKNSEGKVAAIMAIGHAAEKGVEISAAFSALTNLLSDKNQNVKNEAAWALTFAAKQPSASESG